MTTRTAPLPSDDERPTQSVERRLWTADELHAMVRAGVLDESDRIELIGGEVFAMPAKGARHEIVRNELMLNWARRLPVDIKVAEESPLRLGPHDEPEPDLVLFPASLRVADVDGASVLLVVEVTDTTRSFDLTIKASLYASFAVREYWVIDARTLATIVHRLAGTAGYAEVSEVPATGTVTPALVPSLSLSLRTLDVG